MGRFLLLQLELHMWYVPAMLAVGHVVKKAALKLPPKSGFKRESAVADHHKQVGAMLASSSSVRARLGTLVIKPTFLARVYEAIW